MWRRRRKQRDYSDEIDAHLDLEREELVEDGVSEDEAASVAKRNFGNRTRSEEIFYERTNWPSLDHLTSDIRFSLRSLKRNPGFTAAVVVMLTLAIGAGTAIFNIADEALFRPLPLPEPEQLTAIYNYDQSANKYLSSSYPDYVAYRDRAKSFERISAYVRFPLGVSIHEQTERLSVEAVTPEYFDMLRLPPLIGANFSSETAREAMISERLWRERFQADPTVVGSTVSIERQAFTVVGIVPSRYLGANLNWSEPPQAWIPLRSLTVLMPQFDQMKIFDMRSARWIAIFGRRKPDVSSRQAQAELQTIAASLASSEPGNKGISAIVLDASRSKFWPALREKVTLSFGAFGIAAILVLLLACANISNLLLERALSRRREIGVRFALGAPRHRLVRQMLVEALLLTLPGFMGALLFSGVLGTILAKYPSTIGGVGLSLEAKTDLRTFLFGMGFSLTAIALFGVLPALRATRSRSQLDLEKSGTRTTGRKEQWLREVMVVTQIAFTTVLLIGGGLFARSLLKGYAIDPGFHSDHLIVSSIDLGAVPPAARASFAKRIVEESRALPGIESAAVSPHMFMISGTSTIEASTPDTSQTASLLYAGAGLFQALQIPLIEGREFAPEDRQSKRAIISQDLAEKLWPKSSALGRRLSLRRGNAAASEFEVVGVTRPVRAKSVWNEPDVQVYVPQETSTPFWILRTKDNPASQIQQVRQLWQRLAPNVPLWDLRTGDEIMAGSLAPQRLAANLFAAFGLLAVAIASMGLYTITTSSVSRRSREIGIRMAIGAAPGTLVRRILGRALLLAIAGLTFGIASAIKLGSIVSPLIHEVSPSDAYTLSIVAVSMLVVSAFAIVMPAYRAAHIDPAVTLRSE
jgi:putative ABC transport system permease protein